MIAQEFIDDGYPIANILKILRLPRSSYYYIFTMGSGAVGQLLSAKGRCCGIVRSNLSDLPNALRNYVRNDNGSQMESYLVQQYFSDREVTQEFTRPATPQSKKMK